MNRYGRRGQNAPSETTVRWLVAYGKEAGEPYKPDSSGTTLVFNKLRRINKPNMSTKSVLTVKKGFVSQRWFSFFTDRPIPFSSFFALQRPTSPIRNDISLVRANEIDSSRHFANQILEIVETRHRCGASAAHYVRFHQAFVGVSSLDVI